MFALRSFSATFAITLIPQPQQNIRPAPPLLPTAWQIRYIRITRQRLRNLLRGLNATNLDESITGFINRPTNRLCRLSLTLGADDGGLTLLLGLLDDETCALGVLLRNLLLLNGFGEFAPEGHVCDGDVFQGDVEFLGALEEVGADAIGDLGGVLVGVGRA